MYEDERRGRWWCYRGTFPSIAWLHPHAATAAVEAHNLATVARYNRYCGRGLNGGELAQVKPPHRHDNPRLEERPLATVHSPSFLTPPNPYASFSIPIPSASFLPSLPPLDWTASSPLSSCFSTLVVRSLPYPHLLSIRLSASLWSGTRVCCSICASVRWVRVSRCC